MDFIQEVQSDSKDIDTVQTIANFEDHEVFIHTKLNDKDKLEDLLESEKHLIHSYNSAALEFRSGELWKELLNLLCDNHECHSMLWNELNLRGWYRTHNASSDEVQKLKSEFISTQG